MYQIHFYTLYNIILLLSTAFFFTFVSVTPISEGVWRGICRTESSTVDPVAPSAKALSRIPKTSQNNRLF